MKISESGELEFLELIKPFTGYNDNIELGFGDDGAILNFGTPDSRNVITTDMLVEGTHFSLDFCTFLELGIKSYEVNASDIAAMGGWPVAAFLSIGVPGDIRLDSLSDFYRGFNEAAKKHNCCIAGGDTVRSDALTISVMMIGKYQDDTRPLYRSDARIRHNVYITGWPGESGAGLNLLLKDSNSRNTPEFKSLVMKHLLPKARVEEASILAGSESTGAMIDVSDGIFSELNHISRNSKVRIGIECEKLPVSEDLIIGCRNIGKNPIEMILFGGEDYELLFTSLLDLKGIRLLFEQNGSSVPVHRIGTVKKGEGVIFLDENGEAISIYDQTFKHFSALEILNRGI
jgi:thiamine-monophosphate kinase